MAVANRRITCMCKYSTASFAYKDGQLTRASVTQSASQNTHTQK